jgi:hypothetical protein
LQKDSTSEFHVFLTSLIQDKQSSHLDFVSVLQISVSGSYINSQMLMILKLPLSFCIFFVSSTKSCKNAPISFATSVCLSVHMPQLENCWMDFHEFFHSISRSLLHFICWLTSNSSL